jgi:hypothetical protein
MGSDNHMNPPTGFFSIESYIKDIIDKQLEKKLDEYDFSKFNNKLNNIAQNVHNLEINMQANIKKLTNDIEYLNKWIHSFRD